MPDPPLDWLLDGEPYIAYRARVDLLGQPDDDAPVRAAQCECGGLGLTRTTTPGEGEERCALRFREGGRAAQRWPPPFLTPGARME